jgi:hypothetical protein
MWWPPVAPMTFCNIMSPTASTALSLFKAPASRLCTASGEPATALLLSTVAAAAAVTLRSPTFAVLGGGGGVGADGTTAVMWWPPSPR